MLTAIRRPVVEQYPVRRPGDVNRYVPIHDGFLLVRKLVGYRRPINAHSKAVSRALHHWLLFMDGVLVDSNEHMRPLRWGARREHYKQQLWEKSW